MAVSWFYGRGSDITGPVSGSQLSALALSGELLRTDTVWQDGNEHGVPGGKVRNLFPSAPTMEAEAITVISEPIAVEPETIVEEAVAPVAAAGGQMAGTLVPKRGRASAGKGAVIVGQDGTTVKFRMKCTVCGREDSSWKSIPIPRGIARSSFYCIKCRRRREAEIHGYQ